MAFPGELYAKTNPSAYLRALDITIADPAFPVYAILGQIDHVVAIISLTLELHIEQAQSLKDRRQVVRSLKEKLRRGFNISIAEMDEAVTWQSATIGVTAISRSRDYLSGLMRQVEDAAVRIANDLGAQVADSWCSFLEEEAEE
jgi:uncharacterized protein